MHVISAVSDNITILDYLRSEKCNYFNEFNTRMLENIPGKLFAFLIMPPRQFDILIFIFLRFLRNQSEYVVGISRRSRGRSLLIDAIYTIL